MIDQLRNVEALGIHVYGYDAHNSLKSNRRGRLNALAAVEAARQFGITNFMIAGDQIEGPQKEPISEVMAEDLRRLYRNKDRRVVIRTHLEENGHLVPIRDTSREIDAFTEMATQEGWRSFASIASRTHTLSIQQLYIRRGLVQVPVVAMEDILACSAHTDRYQPFLNALHFSSGEARFLAQELVKNVLLLHPQGESWLRARSQLTQNPN